MTGGTSMVCNWCDAWLPLPATCEVPTLHANDPICISDPWKNTSLPQPRNGADCHRSGSNASVNFKPRYSGNTVSDTESLPHDLLSEKAVQEIMAQLENGPFVWIDDWLTRYRRLAKSPKQFMLSMPNILQTGICW